MKRHRRKTVTTEEWVDRLGWIQGGLKALGLAGRGVLYLCGKHPSTTSRPKQIPTSKKEMMQWLLE